MTTVEFLELQTEELREIRRIKAIAESRLRRVLQEEQLMLYAIEQTEKKMREECTE